MSRYDYLKDLTGAWRRGDRPIHKLGPEHRDWEVVGVIVNPKLCEPVLAVRKDRAGALVSMGDHGPIFLGEGYLDFEDRIAYVSGYPRTHTPSGVEIEGAGFGTCLYTSLAVVAKSGFREEAVSSNPEDRSSDASAWWRAAVRRDLATHAEYTEEVDLDPAELSYEDACMEECVSPDDSDVRITGIEVGSVSATGERDVLYDTYSYESAMDHSLVAVRFTPTPIRGFDWKTAYEVAEDVDLQAILALDVRDLTQESINLLLTIARREGADEADLDAMHVRWALGLDPGVEITQQRLPFKPNASERAFMEAAIERTEELREATGWADLADLP